ncbi:putative retrotransposon gag domain-containing protein [Helianthus debilis subsp. tardiflorus]
MSDWRDRRQIHRRFAAGGSGPDQRDPQDIELDRLRDRIRDLEFENEFLQNQDQRRDDERTRTNSVVWDDYDQHDDFHNVFARHQRRPPSAPRPPIDTLRALGLRTEIPEFEGRLHADDFIDWLQTVDRVFDLRDIPENLKVKIVAIRFYKYASLWWENVQKQRQREGKHKVETWEKMRRLLKNKFLPINHKQDSFLDYHNLKQGSLTVEEFITSFEQHRLRCGIDEEEEQIIARFLGALRTDISDVVSLQQYWSFSDVCLLAHRVEKQLALKGKFTTRLSTPRLITAPSNPIKKPSPASYQSNPTRHTLFGPKPSLAFLQVPRFGPLKTGMPQ